MLTLDATTRSIEVDLNGAITTNQLPFVVSYTDIAKGTMELIASSSNTGQTNSTIAVTMVAAPTSANFTRQVGFMSLRNADTVAALPWIQLNDNGTLREIWKGTLAVGDSLIYTDSLGFNVINSSGQIKIGSGISSIGASTDNALVRWDGTGGTAIQNSVVIVSDTGTITGVEALTTTGQITGAAGIVTNGVLAAAGASRTYMDYSSGGRVLVSGPDGSTVPIFSIIQLNDVGGVFATPFSINASSNVVLSGTITVGGNTISGSGAGTLRADGGIRIGADSTNGLLDDASTGAGSTTLYIGNKSILVSNGINFGPSIVTSITVVNGQITAIS